MNDNYSASNAVKVESCAAFSSNQPAGIRYKRGDVRDDGKTFSRYFGKYERWITQDELKSEKAKAAAKQREYYRNNREKVLALEKKCYKKHQVNRLVSRKKYLKSNKEKCASYAKKYVKENRDAVNAWNSNARARRRNALPPKANKRLIDSFYEQANRLSETWSASHIDPSFRVSFHVDHIVPLSCGGLHEHSNLQVVPAIWNLRKNNNLNYPLPSAYANVVMAQAI